MFPRNVAFISALAMLATGCGGGGGGVASIPTGPVTTPPPPPIIPAATTSQQFAVFGVSHIFDGDFTPRLNADQQLQVRYVQGSSSYEVQLPNSQTWEAISYLPSSDSTSPGFSGAAGLSLRPTGARYSALFGWGDADQFYGHEAIGIATPVSGIPVTGSASYSGQLVGDTSNQGAYFVGGSIALSFDFGLGSFSGSISPTLIRYGNSSLSYPLGSIDFVDTVYSTGSTTFSGKFDTNLSGLNTFSGRFTGPNAQELIGNFAFPFQSPIDGQTDHADGAFVGKK